MIILGIETSCDETAVAIIEVQSEKLKAKNVKVLSNVISSQVKLHAKYGGVVPNLAAREHVKNIESVFNHALKEANLLRSDLNKLALIAVTRGPGLGPSLLVGIAFARTLAWKYNKPLVGVNHLEGHIYSNWLTSSRNPKSETLNPKQIQNSIRQLADKTQNVFPVLNLIVSGGHTELVLMSTEGRSASGGEPQIKYKVIGETLDDAVGEAFDKVARLLGLGYPGGPAVAARAAKFKVKSLKFKVGDIVFPRPMINSKNYNFSYAGLKTAVLYKVHDLKNASVKLTGDLINEICYEFQKAALDVLVIKTIKAAQEYKVKSIFLSGGVSANNLLRSDLNKAAEKLGVNYSQPEMEYTGDNAAMVAMAGYFNYVEYLSSRKATEDKEKPQDLTWDRVEMNANLNL